MHVKESGGGSVELAWITCPGTEKHDWQGLDHLPIILSREQATYIDSPQKPKERAVFQSNTEGTLVRLKDAHTKSSHCKIIV